MTPRRSRTTARPRLTVHVTEGWPRLVVRSGALELHPEHAPILRAAVQAIHQRAAQEGAFVSAELLSKRANDRAKASALAVHYTTGRPGNHDTPCCGPGRGGGQMPYRVTRSRKLVTCQRCLAELARRSGR